MAVGVKFNDIPDKAAFQAAMEPVYDKYLSANPDLKPWSKLIQEHRLRVDCTPCDGRLPNCARGAGLFPFSPAAPRLALQYDAPSDFVDLFNRQRPCRAEPPTGSLAEAGSIKSLLDRILPHRLVLQAVITGVALVVLTVIFGWLVFGRYVLNATPTWVEQVSLLLVSADRFSRRLHRRAPKDPSAAFRVLRRYQPARQCAETFECRHPL